MLFPQALAAVLSSTQCVLVLFQLGSKEVQVRRERLFDTTISICWVGVVLLTFFFSALYFSGCVWNPKSQSIEAVNGAGTSNRCQKRALALWALLIWKRFEKREHILGHVFLERIGIVASLGNATRDAPYSCLEAPNHHNSRRGKWNRKGIGSVGIYVRTEG